MRLRFQIAGKRIQALNANSKHALQVRHRFGRCINRHRAATFPTEAAQIVKAHDVVGVRMREDNRIEVPNIFAQRLRPEIGAGIDDKSALRSLNVNGRTGAVVARIG